MLIVLVPAGQLQEEEGEEVHVLLTNLTHFACARIHLFELRAEAQVFPDLQPDERPVVV
jgi:hypothetical protein